MKPTTDDCYPRRDLKPLSGEVFVSRKLLSALLLTLLATAPIQAQEWAVKMFNTTKHDFGPVPRGAKSEFRFKVKNIYEEDVHISGVSSTCNCTTPQVVKADLKKLETGEIIAELNTKQFIGARTATLTVFIDKPFYAEVQLQIAGFIRSDVVVQPGEIDFGNVDLGTATERRVKISYAGREDWSVLEARATDPNLRLQLVDMGRARGSATYELVARLSKDAPAGYLKQQITLITNDAKNPEIPVDVEGRVVSEITVSPVSLFMGVVQPGQKVSKQLVVRGKRPFKITGVKCDDASFDVTTTDDSKVVHVLPVVFTAGDRDGKVSQQIGLETDQGTTPTFTIFAQVVGSSALPTPAKRGEKTDSFRRETTKSKGSAEKSDVEAVLHLTVEPESDEQ
jgi:Protein of unknown function (DUF1573)